MPATAEPADDFPFTLDGAIAELGETVAHMEANGGELPPGLRQTRLVGEPPYDVTVRAGAVIYRVGVGADAGADPADALRRAAERLDAAA